MKEMAAVAQGAINKFMTFDSTKNDLDPNGQEHSMFYWSVPEVWAQEGNIWRQQNSDTLTEAFQMNPGNIFKTGQPFQTQLY